MLTKAKQNNEHRNRRTLHIYLEPPGLHRAFSRSKDSTRAPCAEATPPSSPRALRRTGSLKAHFIRAVPPPKVAGGLRSKGLAFHGGLYSGPDFHLHPSSHLLSEAQAEGTSSLAKKIDVSQYLHLGNARTSDMQGKYKVLQEYLPGRSSTQPRFIFINILPEPCTSSGTENSSKIKTVCVKIKIKLCCIFSLSHLYRTN